MAKKLLMTLLVLFFGMTVTVCIMAVLAPSEHKGSTARVLPYSDTLIWNTLTDKAAMQHYRKDIMKLSIHDTTGTSWAEFSSVKDSILCTRIIHIPYKTYGVKMMNKKNEIINVFTYSFRPISKDSTEVTISENSKSYNKAADVFSLIAGEDINRRNELDKLNAWVKEKLKRSSEN
jgi:hypothetical protein